MNAWFDSIAAGMELSASARRDLELDGFVVLPGPVPAGKVSALADAYDRAVLEAARSEDISNGSATTRVNDFVNRGEVFDPLYIHGPILEACCCVIQEPFRLSTVHARTLRPHSPAQRIHVDFASDGAGWPMVGFILMIDDFLPINGATCFAPGSQGLLEVPATPLALASGPAGSVIVFNGSVWHGHGANQTANPRRSIQGAFIRRTEKPWVHWPARMRSETLARITPLAKYLLAL